MATATAKKPKIETLQEFADNRGAKLKVDRENGVIEGVKILGLNSKNGRTYTEEAARNAIPLYEGSKVNVNHVAGRGGSPRDYRDRMGHLKNVRESEAGGLIADFHVNPKHALAEQLFWDAEKAPENVGFSHSVDGKTKHNGRGTVVEAIDKVYSVDLVADPATTKSLFESQNMKSTVKQIAESCKCEWLSKLAEDAGMGDVAVEPAPEASADEQIKGAFRAMVVAAFDDDSLDSKATIAKIKDILNAQEKLMSKPEKKEPAGDSSDSGDSKPATESLQQKLSTLQESFDALKKKSDAQELDNTIREELRESKIGDVPDAFMNALRRADKAERKSLIEDRRANFNRPQSRDQHITEGAEIKAGRLAKAY